MPGQGRDLLRYSYEVSSWDRFTLDFQPVVNQSIWIFFSSGVINIQISSTSIRLQPWTLQSKVYQSLILINNIYGKLLAGNRVGPFLLIIPFLPLNQTKKWEWLPWTNNLFFCFLCSHLENKNKGMRHLSHKIRTWDINGGSGIKNKMNTKSSIHHRSKSILDGHLASRIVLANSSIYQKSAKRRNKNTGEEFA